MPRSKPCPVCGKQPTAAYFPFCSQGCRDRDLMQWLSEGYAIPAGPADEAEEPSLPGGLDSTEDRD